MKCGGARGGGTTTKIFKMLKQVYGEEIISKAYVLEWNKWFSNGTDEVEFDSWPGVQHQYQMNNIKKVKTMARMINVSLSE
jgi:hypothetical protein